MSNLSCSVCSKSKANLTCGICQDSICKKCAHFVDENYFSFLSKVPKDLLQTTFCPSCFEQKVSPEISKYVQLMEEAKNITVFMRAQAKETRLIKRIADPISVVDCADYAETILRLAFFAAELKYSGIIDVNITAKKIQVGGYKTTVFSGTAIPANIREDKLIKDKSNWSSPN